MLARLLNAVALCLLALASCVGPGVLYVQSPWLFMRDVDPARMRTFFVAYESRGADGRRTLHLDPHGEPPTGTEVRYDLPPGVHLVEAQGSEGRARVEVFEESGGKRVQVFVAGDSPWSSVSEYRVVDNRVQPTRHGRSEPLILLGIVVCLLLVGPIMKVVRRATARPGAPAPAKERS